MKESHDSSDDYKSQITANETQNSSWSLQLKLGELFNRIAKIIHRLLSSKYWKNTVEIVD